METVLLNFFLYPHPLPALLSDIPTETEGGKALVLSVQVQAPGYKCCLINEFLNCDCIFSERIRLLGGKKVKPKANAGRCIHARYTLHAKNGTEQVCAMCS